jgi:hypothetical protein
MGFLFLEEESIHIILQNDLVQKFQTFINTLPSPSRDEVSQQTSTGAGYHSANALLPAALQLQEDCSSTINVTSTKTAVTTQPRQRKSQQPPPVFQKNPRRKKSSNQRPVKNQKRESSVSFSAT